MVEPIGNTPLLRLRDPQLPRCRGLRQVEFFNPGGSIKDRLPGA